MWTYLNHSVLSQQQPLQQQQPSRNYLIVLINCMDLFDD
ncbi:unnamed protein product [Schistosoma margrebowiei]|uniref:Uncharacterized protein n=1 Tax=Schistosoma margrebowiei TaxID=48269 RepID=A0A3P7YFH3_9TREM|nr:unnamed protein product [Schistosoma margrebowiei]